MDGFFCDLIPNAVVIFHCEFSHNRGPQLAGIFREIDRDMNKYSYPDLHYPDVYVLDGGYRQFHIERPELCSGGYTRMLDDVHRANGNLTRETTAWRRTVERLEIKRRKPLVAINQPANYDLLKSPIAMSSPANSPVGSRMLNFVASPIVPRRVIENRPGKCLP
jgi:M-phase inducer tyrosine phosphatase